MGFSPLRKPGRRGLKPNYVQRIGTWVNIIYLCENHKSLVIDILDKLELLKDIYPDRAELDRILGKLLAIALSQHRKCLEHQSINIDKKPDVCIHIKSSRLDYTHPVVFANLFYWIGAATKDTKQIDFWIKMDYLTNKDKCYSLLDLHLVSVDESKTRL